jgi:hypothetical protein
VGHRDDLAHEVKHHSKHCIRVLAHSWGQIGHGELGGIGGDPGAKGVFEPENGQVLFEGETRPLPMACTSNSPALIFSAAPGKVQ